MARTKKAGRGPKQSMLEDEADGDGADINTLTVNKEYARRFQHNKKRDDLHRLKELQKAGVVGDSSSESDEESDDDDGLLLTETDALIFETLKRIRQKDPSIYQKDVMFFKEGEVGGEKQEKGQKKQKAVYLKDVMARQLLEGGGEGEEDERLGLRRKGKSYAEEQQELKNEFLRGVTKEQSEDEEEDDLLRVRKGPSEAALASAPPPKDNEIMARLEAYFGKDDALDEGERFLKDYLANKKWVDQENQRVPTYEEIVDKHPDVSEDEEEVERQEEFEKLYNFRFEEPGAAHVVGHSRLVEGSVRRPDDARKRARQAREERLQTEEAARKQELKRLKNLKKQELQEKLARIKDMAGSLDSHKLTELVDLEDDFDPAAYDKQMAAMFGEDYYEGGEEDEELLGIDEGNDETLLGDETDEAEPIPEKSKAAGFRAARMQLRGSKNGRNEGGKEDKSGEDASEHEEESADEGSGDEDNEEREKAYRVLQEDKRAFEKKLAEYYKLDYEDMVGDLPTRFKYAQVKSNAFGLQTDDILAMDDKELNAIVSLKNIAPYRAEEWRLPKWAKAKLRLSRKERKKKALEHHGAVKKGVKVAKEGKGGDGEKRVKEVTNGVKEGKKSTEGKKKRGTDEVTLEGETEKGEKKRRKVDKVQEREEEPQAEKESAADADGKKKRKRRKKGGAASLGLSESRLQSYGALTVPGKKVH